MELPTGNKTTNRHFFVDNQAIIAQDKDGTEYKTKILTYKQQRWGLIVNMLKTEYLNVGSVIQI